MKAEELFSVEGLSTVVTGGANGLGFAMARALADNGARVTIVDVDGKAAAAAVAELEARGGVARCAVADLADGASVRRAFDETVATQGGLDVVFANAGITAGPGFLTPAWQRDPAGSLENIPEDLWNRVIDVNLNGVFFTIQAAVPHMKKQGHGRIIVTTSIAGTKTSPAVGTPYLATKAAAAHLVRQAAVELARDNILVNSIAPGPFLTKITTPELEEAFKTASPLHRAARTEELEGLVLFFASKASGFVTGAQYVIDGGTLLGRAD
jgi:NAD(P)-dependent dehydrogenase (short-subunit alcohol dehydrogenase family)